MRPESPSTQAIISEISGEVRIEEIKKNRHIVVFNKETGRRKAT